jgi:hypothetical protein
MQQSVVDEKHLEMLSRHIANLEERMIDPREFGRMEQEVKQLTAQVAGMQATLTEINNTLSQAKGGWRTLMLLGGAGAAAGSLVTWALSHVRLLP